MSVFYSSLFRAFTRRQTLAFVFLGNALLFPLAFLFYGAEQEVNPLVRGYPDALWWAFATVTTVGYGDITPVTNAGRLIGVVLMLGGATCFVGFTAVFVPTFMAEFTRDIIESEESSLDSIEKRLIRIEQELRRLNRR
ncbi:potassium channel family protein [Pseudobacteriovorax antillogorgiicola]|uniref:potassium channel family protein n=1 Tax=Pseudobacteriovorax antillogorgiicola TaxID=1513793 RepID=UPI002E14936A